MRTEQLTQWIDQWLDRENPWIRHWSSGKTETLEFFAEFRHAPIVTEVRMNRIDIQFEGIPIAVWWKDWFVKFSGDLIHRFPNIVRLESCCNGAAWPTG